MSVAEPYKKDVLFVDGTHRSNIREGDRVRIVLKQDQRSGNLTEGVVKDILTKSSFHPRGIKVRLADGAVGRVKEISASGVWGVRREVDEKMSENKQKTENQGLNRILDESQRDRERREKTYRERAFKLFPKVCARCGREFSGKRLRELTVHHRDHNHDNNPPDGSNWELLCIYCHENEHSRLRDAQWGEPDASGQHQSSTPIDSPFAVLGTLLKGKK